MKRFLKVSSLLIVSLFVLVSGVDAGLDHLSRSMTQSNYTLYSSNNDAIASYSGDLRLCHPYIKRTSVSPLFLVHRS